MIVETGKQLPVRCPGSLTLGQNNNIYAAQCPALVAETFARKAFHPVTPYCRRQLFLGNRETDAWFGAAVVAIQDRKIAVSRPAGSRKNPLEFSGFQKSVLASEIVLCRGRRTILPA